MSITDLEGCTHGIGGVHSSTSTSSRASMPHHIEPFFITDFTNGIGSCMSRDMNRVATRGMTRTRRKIQKHLRC